MMPQAERRAKRARVMAAVERSRYVATQSDNAAARRDAVVVSQHIDTIGPGRYILNFLLLGVIGLGIAYFLRNRGWLSVWISVAIWAALLFLVVVIGAILSATMPVEETGP